MDSIYAIHFPVAYFPVDVIVISVLNSLPVWNISACFIIIGLVLP